LDSKNLFISLNLQKIKIFGIYINNKRS